MLRKYRDHGGTQLDTTGLSGYDGKRRQGVVAQGGEVRNPEMAEAVPFGMAGTLDQGIKTNDFTSGTKENPDTHGYIPACYGTLDHPLYFIAVSDAQEFYVYVFY